MASVPTPQHEPVAYQSIFFVVLNGLIVFNVVHLTPDQFAWLNGAYAVISGYFVRSAVTPLADPKNQSGEPLTVKA